MRNIKVIMSYRGTAYHGFQRQENAVAVQNVVEDALSELLGSEITVIGCSRTDTGVHANEFHLNFFTDCCIPCDNLVRGINNLLPDDIAFLSAGDVPEEFHSRFDCKGKEYIYLIDNSVIRNVFASGLALHYPYPLDVNELDRAAKHFVGTHDFTSLCGTANLKDNCIRTIFSCDVIKNKNMVKVIVNGDGFLYNMIRIIAGTLIYVAENKIPASGIPVILEGKDRRKAGKTAPAHGLYLNKVYY